MDGRPSYVMRHLRFTFYVLRLHRPPSAVLPQYKSRTLARDEARPRGTTLISILPAAQGQADRSYSITVSYRGRLLL
ncbi:MAG: hypothetical protein WCD37_16885 [Chloroflexia bacterium]